MSRFEVLFCRPSSARVESDGFELEALALEELGIEASVIPFEPIVDGAAEAALERVEARPGRRWLYRGRMLTEEEYESFDEALSERGEQLVVAPHEYALTHYLPNYYPELEAHTADTRWTEGTNLDEAYQAALELGPPPWIVKDHVKSAKEEWSQACYVPAGAPRAVFESIYRRLIELRGERFERGLVIRKLLPLARLPYSTPDGPLRDEHRLFVFGGRIVAHAPYHDVEAGDPPLSEFSYLSNVDSPFFSADVARLENGGWKLIELGDGGVSTLPALLDPRDLYRGLLDADEGQA